jgi:hypothetical protein
MRHSTYTVWDDYVPLNTNPPLTTDAQYNSRLAATDQIAMHAIADNVSGGGTCQIFVQHSSDGKNWLYRNSNSATTVGTAEITLALGGTVPIQLMWSDSCLSTTTGGPLLSFVRLLILTATGGSCHLKIHMTHRDGSR